MSRKRIPQEIQAIVLIKGRRRCCICFGLNHDTTIKVGQIAHLDRDNNNNSEQNLAFLCFEHHDQYDSSTRQSKNFTIEEIKHYRDELYNTLALSFSNPVSFGNAQADLITGHYMRIEGYSKAHSAELLLSRLLDGRYHVSGTALWGVDRMKTRGVPNIGVLDFVAESNENVIQYSWESFHKIGDPYLLRLQFSLDGLVATEENDFYAPFGMNVRFGGGYAKMPMAKDGYEFPLGGWSTSPSSAPV